MRIQTLLAGAALCASASLFAPLSATAAPSRDAITAETFAAPSTMDGPRLSPDGSKIAAKMLIDGKMQLTVTPVAGGQSYLLDAGDLDVNWWSWANDNRLLIGLGGTETMYGMDVYITRLASVASDLTGFTKIDWGLAGQLADRVLFMPNDNSNKILISKQTGFDQLRQYYPSVFEADIVTGKAHSLLSSRDGVDTWIADGKGNIRLGHSWNEWTKKDTYYYRASNADSFTAHVDDGSLPIPQIFRPDGTAIGFSDKDGFDEVYEISLPSFTLGKKIFAAPGYDVGAMYASDSDDEIIGVSYYGKRYQQQFFDPALKAAKLQMDKAVGAGNGRIVSMSRDHSKLLVDIGGPSQAGGLYYWDTNGAQPRLINWNNADLRDRTLSRVSTITYPARDSTPIEAVVTLPRGRAATNLPLIVLPHGGPGARDWENYDWWAQYLAELGYAVIQPNYRGSTGYGAKFHDLAEGQFGLKMQDDLLDAIEWAAKAGIADRKRVCIAGASYGGYAAMRGAQRDGAAYRCAISFAGVSDVKDIMRYDRQFFIGDDPKKYWRNLAPDFAAISPRYHAAEFTVPILLMHGVKDKRVPVRQSRDLAAALQKAGKQVVYVEQPEGDHHFSRTADRLQFLQQMKLFLDKHNPA